MGSGCSSPKSSMHVVDTVSPHHAANLSTAAHHGGGENTKNRRKEESKITRSIRHDDVTIDDNDITTDFTESFFTPSVLVHNTIPHLTNEVVVRRDSIFDRRRKVATRHHHAIKRWDSFDSDLQEESEDSSPEDSPPNDERFYLEMSKKSIIDSGNSNENENKNSKTNHHNHHHHHHTNNNRFVLDHHYHSSQQSLFNSQEFRRASLVPSIQSIPEDGDQWMDALEAAFAKFAKFGEMNTNVNEMNRTSWAKFCKDCAFVDNANLVTGDVDVIFIKNKLKGQRFIDFEGFMKSLDEIADRKLGSAIRDPMERRELIYKSVIGRNPDLTGATEFSRTRHVRRMTDHNLYPIAHKLRFDEKERKLLKREASSHSLIGGKPTRRTSMVPSDTESLISRSLSPTMHV